MTKIISKRAVADDNPFTLDYHRKGAATSPTSRRRRAKQQTDAFGSHDTEENTKDSIHPINNKRGMLLGEGAIGCDWGDEVLLSDVKDADITNKKIIFAYKANDDDKEIYIKSMSVVIRNILFSINISYTMIYGDDDNYEAMISSFTTTNALNSKGRFITLTLSEAAKRDLVMDILEMNEDQIKYPAGIIDSSKCFYLAEPSIQNTEYENERIAS